MCSRCEVEERSDGSEPWRAKPGKAALNLFEERTRVYTGFQTLRS